MTLFWAIAAGMTAVALLFLLPPLLRQRTAAPDARVTANAAIYREQLEELAAELQRGAVTREEFERASREVEHRIVAEHADGGGPAPAAHRQTVWAALAVGLLLPLAVALGYWQLGEPRALNPVSAQQVDPNQMEALVERLSAQLKLAAQDAEGWAVLARAQASLGRHEPAAQAYARALQLMPENRDLLVEFIKTLALAGRTEFESKNFAGAIGYWERILPFAPQDSEFARTVTDSIAEARTLGGLGSPSMPSKQIASSQKALAGIVSLDASLKEKAAPQDTVFVLARPASGSRMPLAVVRTTVDRLPYQFTLDDSMAMSPNAKLSGHAKVVVVARISKSGNAAPQKGDIEGVSAAVAPGASGVRVVLSKTVE